MEMRDFDDDKAQEENEDRKVSRTLQKLPWVASSPPTLLLHHRQSGIRASGTTGAFSDLPSSPPPPPVSSTRQEDQSTGTAAPSSSKTAASAEYSAWTHVQVLSSDDEVGRDHVPTVNLRQSWWKPLTEDRPSTPEPAWTIP
ncbi:hypothetical protein Tco_0425105 [Tanacetum coccineum]